MTRGMTTTALLFALTATPAFGQAPPAGSAGKLAVNDALFAQAAAAGGLAEVGISELGVSKATDPALKEFSKRMVQEHGRVNSELMTIAGSRRMELPRALDARAAFCSEALAGLSGEEFDRCYAKAQVVAHMDALAAFKAESERGQDPQLRAFAAKVLPHIEEHLKTIKPIAKKYEKE